MEVSFKGNVDLEAGSWTVGLVQNLDVQQYDQRYSRGGVISEFIPGLLLDRNVDTGDIWFGDASQHVDQTARGLVAVHVSGRDTPSTGAALGSRDRANKTITETLDSVVNVLLFRMALVARRSGDRRVVFLASTVNPYGVVWAMDVDSSGGATVTAEARGTSGPFSEGNGARVVTDGPAVAFVAERRRTAAINAYLADRTKK